MKTGVAERRGLWVAVALFTALGLALRIAAAQGALWLDEAWSAVAAHEVATPMGVLLRINHDNNHHLNTLWLQLVGLDAQPLVQRALSIATGTLAIPLAAVIGLRQGRGAALCAALLFAISPLLVTYGAEARGYAPMVLAMLATVLLTARWLDDPEQRVPGIGLFGAVLLGMLSQLTMAFGLAALGLWVGWAQFRSRPPRVAFRNSARVLLPVVIAATAVLALVFGAARAAGTGLQFGNYDAFSLWKLADGWGAMMFAALGGPIATIAAILLIAPPDVPGDRAGQARDRLFFLFALLIPLGVALFQIGNSGAPRYHLLSGVGALMLIAIHSGPRLARRHPLRLLIMAALALVTVASLITDWRIIGNRRADPGVALDAMAMLAPVGTEIAVEHPRASAVMRAGAASRHYTLKIVESPCPAARFFFVDRDGDAPFPDPKDHCIAAYRIVAEGHPTGLSGTHWKLYERVAK
jgi:hypothetical protein